MFLKKKIRLTSQFFLNVFFLLRFLKMLITFYGIAHFSRFCAQNMRNNLGNNNCREFFILTLENSFFNSKNLKNTAFFTIPKGKIFLFCQKTKKLSTIIVF